MKAQSFKASIVERVKSIWRNWSIAFRIVPIMVLVATLKLLSHQYGLEFMELNALFTCLVAGTIFLIGFLIAGVLFDYIGIMRTDLS